MSFSYDETLSTTRDVVRFLVSDIIGPAASALFQDEEIDGIITLRTGERVTAAALPYDVAALLLGQLLTRFSFKGKGVEEKVVDKLRIRFGIGGQSSLPEAIRAEMESLRRRASYLGASRGKLLRAV